MVRLPAFILAGCALGAALMLFYFGSVNNRRSSPATRSAPTKIEAAALELRNPVDPQSTPTPRRAETASSANGADSALRGVRLTGVVIGPDLRIAVFAVPGAGSRMLSEGETLKGWRLDSISSKGVVLRGPAGKTVLEPEPDAKLVRSPPPVAVPSDQPAAVMAAAPPQPIVVTPVTVVNLPAAIPGPTQASPYYFPQYYPEYGPYSLSGWGWGNPWGWGWPVGVFIGSSRCGNCGFRGGFFRPGFRRFGFGRPGFSHPGFTHSGFTHANFAGGFRSGGGR